jgi:hypothetical protein
MLRVLLGGALMVLPAAPLQAGGKAMPKGPPPRVMMALVDADGRAYIETTRYTTRIVVQKVQVKVGDRVEERGVNVPVTVAEMVKVPLDAEGTRLMTADGKRVGPRDLKALLTKTSPILFSSDGRDVDPFYLRLARPGTLVVIAPGLAPPGEMPVPLPPPLPPRGGDGPEKKPAPR